LAVDFSGGEMSDLFSEINIRNVTIKNRIVMPPMVCIGWAGEDGLVTGKHIEHYEARAKGGVGLIIVEATCVSVNGRLADRQLGLWSDAQIDGFRNIASVCHKYGARILVQLHHAGLGTPRSVSPEMIAPSKIEGPSDFPFAQLTARALTLEEIKNIQADFVAAAVRANKAGFDGVELHGAHGHLISEFFSPLTNRRQDVYGGTIENRTRFVSEIISAIRKVNGEDFIIGCRMGSNDPDLINGIEIALRLEKAGVDLLHVSTGMTTIFHTDSPENHEVPADFKYNWRVYWGTEIKKKVKVPVVVVNGIRTPEQADYLIEHNMADFVAIGKGLLADPDWANKAQHKLHVTGCKSCKTCSYFRQGGVCPPEPKIMTMSS
jgi:NADPH2 dehydrogenase